MHKKKGKKLSHCLWHKSPIDAVNIKKKTTQKQKNKRQKNKTRIL